MAVARIYADFNGLVRGPSDPERTAVVLDTFGSLRDLSNAGVILRRGIPLIAFDLSDQFEDLEGHGTAQYDEGRKRWVVEFDELGVRDVPAKGQRGEDHFLCVHCREPIAGASGATVARPGFACARCGTHVLAAIAPPLPRT